MDFFGGVWADLSQNPFLAKKTTLWKENLVKIWKLCWFLKCLPDFIYIYEEACVNQFGIRRSQGVSLNNLAGDIRDLLAVN